MEIIASVSILTLVSSKAYVFSEKMKMSYLSSAERLGTIAPTGGTPGSYACGDRATVAEAGKSTRCQAWGSSQ
jgi:hypothetical protein